MLASPAADLRHVTPVAADGLASLLSRLPRLSRRKLVSRALFVGGAATLGGNCPLALVTHAGESSERAGGTL